MIALIRLFLLVKEFVAALSEKVGLLKKAAKRLSTQAQLNGCFLQVSAKASYQIFPYIALKIYGLRKYSEEIPYIIKLYL